MDNRAELTKPPVQVEGDDSPEIRVVADECFLPPFLLPCRPISLGPGQQAFVHLVWAPVSDFDLAGYNIYRHEEGTAPIKLNAELVKTPAYRDANVMPSKKYVYSVSAVDVRGNESAGSEEASEVVP